MGRAALSKSRRSFARGSGFTNHRRPYRRTATPRALRVFIDPDLLEWDEVWASDGTRHGVFPIAPAGLVSASGGTVVTLKRS